jgi:hypothetical protein
MTENSSWTNFSLQDKTWTKFSTQLGHYMFELTYW